MAGGILSVRPAPLLIRRNRVKNRSRPKETPRPPPKHNLYQSLAGDTRFGRAWWLCTAFRVAKTAIRVETGEASRRFRALLIRRHRARLRWQTHTPPAPPARRTPPRSKRWAATVCSAGRPTGRIPRLARQSAAQSRRVEAGREAARHCRARSRGAAGHRPTARLRPRLTRRFTGSPNTMDQIAELDAHNSAKTRRSRPRRQTDRLAQSPFPAP